MSEITARVTLGTPLGPLTICVAEGKVVEVGFPTSTPLPDFSLSDADKDIALSASSQLTEYFAGKRQVFELPLLARGTRFQESIWSEIEKVPFGQTATYKDLAIRAGKPKAARAVGGAVGANPIGIIIGCHRILGSTGKLTGYSGGHGIPTKVKLLELEGIEYK